MHCSELARDRRSPGETHRSEDTQIDRVRSIAFPAYLSESLASVSR
ncbi:hypothetical protein JJD41_08940 [Oxynema sp. CENA135]|nr:hypothetical protein [Oxynema sp. CENA135]MBK4729987.1 hypothetical protein [Oxynema sp. CENA135]